MRALGARVSGWVGAALVALVLLVGGCGAEEAPGALEGGEDGAEEGAEQVVLEAEESDFELLLANAIRDTLRGSAAFGTVFDPGTGETAFVIDLSTGRDFAGGFIIARHGDAMPSAGTYELAALTDSTRALLSPTFAVVYREGMLRDLRSSSGTLVLSSVADTLIEGRIDAVLRGLLVTGSQPLPQAEVHARGRFRARPGNPGYIVGL